MVKQKLKTKKQIVGTKEQKPKTKDAKARGPMITEDNLRTLKELLTGKYLTGGISEENSKQLGQALGVSKKATYYTLRKLEEMGIIVGYIPLLSEEGKRILDALELMYGLKKGNHDALVDMVEAH